MGKRRQCQQRKENGGVDSCSGVDNSTEPLQSIPKRNNCPGVRVIGGRIYDPKLGKTCHQCRQKTLDFAASCKNVGKDRSCPIKYCHKCLLNRYGEKAEEVEVLIDWKCPKCRGLCNCSVCMKKRGVKPTGILVLQAKSSGFLSVSDMLNVGDNGAFTKKTAAVTKEPVVGSTRKRGKENYFDGNNNSKMCPPNLSAKADEKKSKRRKQEASKKEDDKEKNGAICKPAEDLEGMNIDDVQPKRKAIVSCSKLQGTEKIEQRDFVFDIKLPQGVNLSVVAGIELRPEDVGDALQFLEFCGAFREMLDIKEGQPKCILRELLHGRRGRQAQFSSAAQFHIQLLSLIMLDSGEESPSLNSENGSSSWLQALEKCISESQCSFKELSSDSFELGGYDKLESSKKLKLLNFLCDEALGTVDTRNWIEDQNKIFLAEKKQAKEKVFAARHKKKNTKRKLQDEIAKAIIAKNGAPLSISEHGAIVSEMKAAVDKAHVELLAAREVEAMEKQYSNAVRTSPVILDGNGLIYWRLKGYSCEPDILLQDMGCREIVVPSEKWFMYTVEQKLEVEKYVSFVRSKKSEL